MLTRSVSPPPDGGVSPGPDPPPAPPSGGVALPTYEVHVKPNYNDGSTDDTRYRYFWVDHTSNNTSALFPNESSMIATPASVDPRATKKSWIWYFAHEIKIDPSWDSTKQGAWGTTAPEAHFSSHDVGNTGHGGIGWGFGAPGSAYQKDYTGGTFYEHVEMEFPSHLKTISANMTKGVWHSVITELICGRTDGSVSSVGHPYGGNGRVRCWFDGNDTPVVDTGPINTLQRATNPDNGITYTQTLMSMYTTGFYTRQDNSNFIELIFQSVAVRVGTSVSACMADRPLFAGSRGGNIYTQSGVDLGPSYYVTLTGANQRTTATFLLPPSLS